jgi:gluconolactonase
MAQEFLHLSSPALHHIVPAGSRIEKIAGGFAFTEGPIWTRDGALLFSDIPRNTIYRWTPDSGISEWLKPSGFDGEGAPDGALIGSNGLTLDAQGRVVICQHGNRRVVRRETDGSLSVLASHEGDRRLNSPNDLIYHSDGSLYFTDPPYGLVKQDEDPAKELPYNGVYRLSANGQLRLLYKDLARPNGLLLSPDEKLLFVGNSDPKRKLWMRFELAGDGSLTNAAAFADVSEETARGNPDGMKIDREGNLYCTGPGGIWVFTLDGVRLGVIEFPEIPANLHWGDEDAQTLYVTARTGLYRIRLNIPGIRP